MVFQARGVLGPHAELFLLLAFLVNPRLGVVWLVEVGSKDIGAVRGGLVDHVENLYCSRLITQTEAMSQIGRDFPTSEVRRFASLGCFPCGGSFVDRHIVGSPVESDGTSLHDDL